MAFAFLSLGVMNIVELSVQADEMNIQTTKMIALLVCLFQSFLFTYTNITLINIHFITKQKVLLESIPIILFCILTLVSLSIYYLSGYAEILFYTFIAYYISVLIRYTVLFQKNYKNYILKMDNFYAEQEYKRFRWIYFSFYAALTLGIMALIVTLFFSIAIGIIFSIFIIVFYSYYGVQFINYAYIFQNIEAIITKNEKDNILTTPVIRDYSLLEANIERWTTNKMFLKNGINIELAAKQLNTNRTYLSDYVNTYLQKTFKEWISELRINEAKKLLLQYPGSSITDICEMAGFSDKSNFGRLFTKQTGMSPQVWRTAKEVNIPSF
jgi:AraC-like DNA-binding protein